MLRKKSCENHSSLFLRPSSYFSEILRKSLLYLTFDVVYTQVSVQRQAYKTIDLERGVFNGGYKQINDS